MTDEYEFTGGPGCPMSRIVNGPSERVIVPRFADGKYFEDTYRLQTVVNGPEWSRHYEFISSADRTVAYNDANEKFHADTMRRATGGEMSNAKEILEKNLGAAQAADRRVDVEAARAAHEEIKKALQSIDFAPPEGQAVHVSRAVDAMNGLARALKLPAPSEIPREVASRLSGIKAEAACAADSLCDWTGKASDVLERDGRKFCPKCGGTEIVIRYHASGPVDVFTSARRVADPTTEAIQQRNDDFARLERANEEKAARIRILEAELKEIDGHALAEMSWAESLMGVLEKYVPRTTVRSVVGFDEALAAIVADRDRYLQGWNASEIKLSEHCDLASRCEKAEAERDDAVGQIAALRKLLNVSVDMAKGESITVKHTFAGGFDPDRVAARVAKDIEGVKKDRRERVPPPHNTEAENPLPAVWLHDEKHEQLRADNDALREANAALSMALDHARSDLRIHVALVDDARAATSRDLARRVEAELKVNRMRPLFDLAMRWAKRPISCLAVGRNVLENDAELFAELHRLAQAAGG